MSEAYSFEEKQEAKRLAGIPHLPTDMTLECRNAVAGIGPRAYDWSDKPHRLVYDLCREIEAVAVVTDEMVEQACRAYLYEHDIDPDYPYAGDPTKLAWWTFEAPAMRKALKAALRPTPTSKEE
jgi:hypothetical protein